MSVPKTIVVTGANRGIGQAICRLLLSDASLVSSNTPFRLLATSRQGQNLSFSSPHQQQAQILYPRLDISSSSSIAEFTRYIRDEIKTIHVLINNAGINVETGQMAHIPDGPDGAMERHSLAKKSLDVNYHGTKNLTLSLLPFMASYQDQAPRIVSLSSVASSLSAYSSAIQSRFRNPENSFADLDRLAQDYLSTVESSTEEQNGFSLPGRAYSISKALINAFTIILARDNPNFQINSCCPGWIATDMGGLVGSGRMKPPKTAEEGALIPLKLAMGDIGQTSGKYWANGNVRSKDTGQVQSW